MSDAAPIPLLLGEIFVDFTLMEQGQENKLRFGGIAHAARGFWAVDQQFSAAVILPRYLESLARLYLSTCGCVDFFLLGEVSGAPNITVIHDATEVADQGYETLLRDEKSVELSSIDLSDREYRDVLIFPGSYNLLKSCAVLPAMARLHLDVAYDLENPQVLADLRQSVETIFISTSSPLFKSLPNLNLEALAKSFEACTPTNFILKENRGGSRLLDARKIVTSLPAQLGSTVNSVGVGDVFAAAYVALLKSGAVEAGLRATYVAAAYSQTTYPDQFKTYVERDMKLSVAEMQELGGVFLPWEMRREYPIYLAAPDFTYVDRRAIERAIASLSYHNFAVRRPVIENGELPMGSNLTSLRNTYCADYELLRQCALVFAVPTGRDPGTLVEIGIAIEANKPVIVYDPERECANTMVMAGAQHYSADLDSCLNTVFKILSKAWKS